MEEKKTDLDKKPRSRGAALIKSNSQIRSEMARIYRSFNAGDISMDEMNKRVAVLDKIRLTLMEPSKPKTVNTKLENEKLTIREKLILNRIERNLESRIYGLLQKYVKVQAIQEKQA